MRKCVNDFLYILLLDIIEEELFAQFNKIANSILHSKSKEQQNTVESSPRNGNSGNVSLQEYDVKGNCSVPGGLPGENTNPVMKIKALQVDETK